MTRYIFRAGEKVSGRLMALREAYTTSSVQQQNIERTMIGMEPDVLQCFRSPVKERREILFTIIYWESKIMGLFKIGVKPYGKESSEWLHCANATQSLSK